MALPRFFKRVYTAAGGLLAISEETLQSKLGSVTIAIRLDSSWSADSNACLAASFAVNLCSRLYASLDLTGPQGWVDSASALARSINPSVELTHTGTAAFTLVIGNDAVAGNAMWLRSDGWVARVLARPTGATPGAANPLAAAASACLAVAELFRRVFHEHVPQVAFKDINVSLLDYGETSGAEEPLASASIGDVALVGVGAVGNAAAWCLSHLSLQGTITAIDAQTIDESNLQRYVLAHDQHIGALKTALARSVLDPTGARVIPITAALEDVAVKDLPPTLAVSVDNIATRRAVQALLPRLAINGWTGDRSLGASWHFFGENGPCLACEYHPRGTGPSQFDLVSKAFGIRHDRVGQLWISGQGLGSSDIAIATRHLKLPDGALRPWLGRRIQDLYSDVACGQVGLDLSGVGRIEAVPLAHQSALAGVLLAAELVRRTDAALSARSSASPMIVWDDVLHLAPKQWTQKRPPRPRCICADEIYRARYKAKWLSDNQ